MNNANTSAIKILLFKYSHLFILYLVSFRLHTNSLFVHTDNIFAF